jgi:hypothetical protein
MIDTPTATAADLAAEKPTSKKSSPTKTSTSKKKTVTKKTARKPAHSKEKKASTSKAAAKAKPAKQAKSTKKKLGKPKTSKADKPKKPKLVRDSFTMPEQEYAVLGQMKKTCLAGGMEIKKSELLRIGVAQLAAMDLKKLKAAQAALTPLKAGRPKKAK